MKYDLSKLNPYDFETLVQALCRRVLGYGTISFGDGTDGGREATFEGAAPFPSKVEMWDGYWVVQAKFKAREEVGEDDFAWVKKQLLAELKKLSTRKVKVKMPDNYLLFTNATLTAQAGTGGRDKADKLIAEMKAAYDITNMAILSNDDIQDYLTNFRDIAIAYAPFVLPGDVLNELMKLLQFKEDRIERVKEVAYRFIEAEFVEDLQSKLDHAGKLTSDRVNLEKVFVDLSTNVDQDDKNNFKFIDHIVSAGNSILKYNEGISSRYVLVAGPALALMQVFISRRRATNM